MNASIQDHLRELEERLLDPSVRNDRDRVARLLADEFVEFGSSGRVFTRRQILDALQNEQPTRRVLTGFRAVMLAPGVALTTYRVERLESPAASVAYSLRSSVWKQSDGVWQMVFHQGTRAALAAGSGHVHLD